MTLPIANLQFIISNMFATGVYVTLKKIHFTREVLIWFSFFFIFDFSEGIDTHVSLPYFFLNCAIATLIVSFDLRLKNM